MIPMGQESKAAWLDGSGSRSLMKLLSTYQPELQCLLLRFCIHMPGYWQEALVLCLVL